MPKEVIFAEDPVTTQEYPSLLNQKNIRKIESLGDSQTTEIWQRFFNHNKMPSATLIESLNYAARNSAFEDHLSALSIPGRCPQDPHKDIPKTGLGGTKTMSDDGANFQSGWHGNSDNFSNPHSRVFAGRSGM